MKTLFSKIFSFSIFFLLVLCFASCENDSDLLAEYVILEQDGSKDVAKSLAKE